MSFTPDKIRDIVVLGHQSSGKTTLVESLFQVATNNPTKGFVEKGTTVSDYLKEEQDRLSSISASVVPIEYEGYRINLIDLPGNDDFVGEIIGVTSCVKGAILVIDATSGVQQGTIKHFRMLKRKNIPTLIFVNKMDKENIDFDSLLADIRAKLGKKVAPFCYPLGHADQFDGFANCVDLKARIYNGKECVDAEIYEDKKPTVLEYNNMVLEAVATTSEELLNKFFSGETLTREEIHKGLRKGVLDGEIDPLLVGSATKNIGCHTLLNMCIDYLPSPSDLEPFEAYDKDGNLVERKTTSEEPFSGYCFKTISDLYSGVINIIKVNSGSIGLGDEVYCPSSGKTTKVSSLFYLEGKKQIPVERVEAGDVVAIAKLEDVRTGDTICDPKNIIKYVTPKYPTAVYFRGIELANKKDEDKISTVLQKLCLEDPTIEVKRNQETKQLLVGGLGNHHLSYILDKLKNTYKIECKTVAPKIVYRESIKGKAEATGKYIKQSGGSGFYGVVVMDFEPAEENCFEETVFGGTVPKQYFPAVEKGFYEALQSGLLAGFPVIGVKGTLKDGKYHPVDSNEMAFKMAAILAFKEAYMHCKPIILEPIMRVTIYIENKYIGDVISDLNTRRAKNLMMEEDGAENQKIIVSIPEAEINDYSAKLKSITQGGGYFNRQFECYEEVPANLKDRVIQENSLNKDR